MSVNFAFFHTLHNVLINFLSFRFRSVIRSNKGLKSKQIKNYKNEREEKKRIKAYEQSLKDAVKKEKEDLRLRQEANKKQREENERKCEVYQEVVFDLCHYQLIVSKTENSISISDQEPSKIEEDEKEAIENDCKERRFENAEMIYFPFTILILYSSIVGHVLC